MKFPFDCRASIVEIIRIEFNRGNGIDDSDPVRKVTAYFEKDGIFLFEKDPCAED